MPFKDKLRELIERHGGMDEENLARIVRLARQIKLEFSMAYLIKLLNGQRFRQGDIEAICTALGEHPHELFDDPEPQSDRIRRMAEDFASITMGRPDLCVPFCTYVGEFASFRNLSIDDLFPLWNQFLADIDDEQG